MSFSGTTFEQREKETKALKGFLVLSLIGSLGFHLAVLASGIGNYFSRVSPVEEEAIEIAVLDTPQENKLEVQPQPEQSPQKLEVQEKTEVLASPTVKPENQVNPVTLPAKVELPPPPQPKQPIQKLVEKLQKPIEPTKPETNVAQKPVAQTTEKPSNTNSTNSSNSSSNLRDTLRGIRNSNSSQSLITTAGNGRPSGGGGGGTSVLTGNGTGVGSGSGSGIGTGKGTGIGSGSGSGVGSGNGSGIGNGNGSGVGNGNNSGNGGERIATTSTTPKLPSTGNGEGNSRGNGDGRAACQECNVRYSERARKRKAEGRVAVAVDTDANGNVTNVRLIGSSGDRDLDEEHLRQARNWKLKPSQNGRQGVQIATEYAIQGSRRHNQVRKQQQEREQRQRQREISSNNNSGEETPRRRQRREAGVTEGSDRQSTTSTDASRINQRLRVQRSEGENSLANRLQRRQREVTADVRTSGETPQRLSRRRRRPLQPSAPPSDSASRLRNALRRSAETAPVASPSPNGSQ
ncbi:energy transducer TonB [Calothrix sp. NIES-2098]|uniref:energy transducer TonB n=1 Tax=Calothrix sp. NIES-2098 TaxID=1954171 RepID=UPI000B60D2A9|nr:hypothetical protein NIES2098_33290 [Calothrix sp. NIES-2098]